MSKICEYCGKEFDEDEARDDFEGEVLLCYDYLTKCLCADCAIEAIKDEEDGIYLELCENCGARFDPFEVTIDLRHELEDDGIEIDMFGKYLCRDCFLEEYQNNSENDLYNEDLYEEDSDDDSGEGLSVWDAAQIWASHGKDEDYMFGYSEEDLENAL